MSNFIIGGFTGALIGSFGYVVGFLSSKSILEDKSKPLESNLDLQNDFINKNLSSLPKIELQGPTQPKEKETIKIPFYVADFIKQEKKDDKKIYTILSDVFGSFSAALVWNSELFNFSDVKSWIGLPGNTEKFIKAVLYGNYEIEE